MKNLLALQEDFSHVLIESIEKAWGFENSMAHLEQLALSSEKLRESIFAIGDFCMSCLHDEESLPQEQKLISFINTFLWPEEVKSFLLLWRDVLFQQQKALLLFSEGLVRKEELVKLHIESKAVLLSHTTLLSTFVQDELKSLKSKKSTAKLWMSKCKLQTNPWPVYKEQLDNIPQQCQYIFENYKLLSKTSEGFAAIQDNLNKTFQDCQKELGEIEALVRNIIAFVDDESKKGSAVCLKNLTERLKGIENKQRLANYVIRFESAIEPFIASMPSNIEVPIGTEGGMLLRTDFDIQTSFKKWLESEILPLLYELFELTESASYSSKMALINIRNNAILLSNESNDGKYDFRTEKIYQPLNEFLNRTQSSRTDIITLHDMAISRMARKLKVSHLLDVDKPFLPVPFQFSLQQLNLKENWVIAKIKDWLTKENSILYRFRKTAVDDISNSERIVRLIKSRTGDPANAHYSSIFLTKGLVGDSFIVGRISELDHVSQLVSNWKKGFSGSLLLTGPRYCGKTLFGELISTKFFMDDTISLSPGESFHLAGRKMDPSYSLSENLNFIRKYTSNENQMIWIDDFELWWEPGIPLLENFRSLVKFIDSFSTKKFIVVSMSNCLRQHLDGFFELDKIFQSIINLDKMPAKEIEKAILIHHGATHMELVGPDRVEISPRQFNKLSTVAVKSAKGNIGDALNIWSNSTKKAGETYVETKIEHRGNIPEFMSDDMALLLSTIAMHKRINEYRLRRIFGPAFSEIYVHLLQRMVNMGVVQRHLDGWLEINEVLANDLGRSLQRLNYLNYTV